ncbi:MAG: L-aspartate oxidase [Thermodesulfobacteriota bacterium]
MQSDILIIGSGIAGLSFALKMADLGSVALVTKKARVDTATNLAQGGIAAVLAPGDSCEAHVADTLASGAGLCHEDVVRMVVEEGPERVRELQRLGVHFTQRQGMLDLGREGGHSARRIAHARDLTGREIERALLEAVAANPAITVIEDHFAVDLLIASRAGIDRVPPGFDDVCLGAYLMDCASGVISPWTARVTALCTGGSGKVYLYTTNPDIATGDGVAMAYRAGARVANLEFVQFHPTCLYHPKAKNFLISEAVRGEGGVLIDRQGRAFMGKYDNRADLATRDTVARAIDAEMKTSGDDCVYLDISHRDPDFLRGRFPTIHEKCLSLGIDMTREPIPVVPAAHYQCGGVVTAATGQTSLHGLFALGEVAHTGLHGGNRLASNSLLEAVVFAHQAARCCHADWSAFRSVAVSDRLAWSSGNAARIEECVLITHNWDQIRRLMWNYVGIVRSETRLRLARKRLEPILQEIAGHYRRFLLTPDLIELRNIALLAELVVTSAVSRRESRGLHFMTDYPERDDAHFLHDTVLRKPRPVQPSPARESAGSMLGAGARLR